MNGGTINSERMEFLTSLIQEASLFKKELNSKSLVKSNYKIQMIEGRESFSKNKIYIQEKLKEKKDFILDFYISNKMSKWNGYKTVNMTFSIYLKCIRTISKTVFSFQTNRMKSKNIPNQLKPKNKAKSNSCKNKKSICSPNKLKSQ